MPTSVTVSVPLIVREWGDGLVKPITFSLALGKETLPLTTAMRESAFVQDLLDDLKEAGEQRNESAV
jgi:hypothetical protein